MQNRPLKYIRLQSDDPLPDISELQPFKAIVVIEDDVSQMWQWEVSRWLASSGCRYMMAWGRECSSWDDSVDEANLEAFNYEEIPESQFIMTTWHEDEELSDVFWFSKHSAHHPCHEMRNTVILHISKEDKQQRFEEEYANA
jgi:hypothetical protein